MGARKGSANSNTQRSAAAVLLKADTVTLQITSDKDGKLRVKASSLDEAVVILPGQRLEAVNRGGQVVLTRVGG